MKTNVEMLQTRFEYFPQRFTLDGATYDVTQVMHCQTITAAPPRIVFYVNTAQGRMFRIERNVSTSQWTAQLVHIQKGKSQ